MISVGPQLGVQLPFLGLQFATPRLCVNMKPFAAALFTLLVLTGCGQKGPLYIPEDTASVPAQTETAEQSTQK